MGSTEELPVYAFARRLALLATAGCLLAGCDLINTESPFWATVAAGLPKGNTTNITRAQADAIPYASILAWMDDGPRALMILSEARPDGSLMYLSSSRQAVVIKDGFVVRTSGIQPDLTALSFMGDKPPDLRDAAKLHVARVVDIQSLAIFGARMTSTFSVGAPESVMILERPMMLVPVTEVVTPTVGKTFTNIYWIEPSSGKIWKSRQRPYASAPYLNLEVVKPYLG